MHHVIRLTRVVPESNAAKLARAHLLITTTFVAFAATILMLAPRVHAQNTVYVSSSPSINIATLRQPNGDALANNLTMANTTDATLSVSLLIATGSIESAPTAGRVSLNVLTLKPHETLTVPDFRTAWGVASAKWIALMGCRDGTACNSAWSNTAFGGAP